MAPSLERLGPPEAGKLVSANHRKGRTLATCQNWVAWNNRNVFSQCGGWKSAIKAPAGPCSRGRLQGRSFLASLSFQRWPATSSWLSSLVHSCSSPVSACHRTAFRLVRLCRSSCQHTAFEFRARSGPSQPRLWVDMEGDIIPHATALP